MILTAPTWLYKFKSPEEEMAFKEKLIKDILDGKFATPYTLAKITKVCYIDNNQNCTKYLNEKRGEYSYLAMSVPDFLDKNYSHIILS